VTLNVLRLLTPLADLEEPGSKNIIRENSSTPTTRRSARKLFDQVYFSDFVVQ
jgi:flagellar FliL protein